MGGFGVKILTLTFLKNYTLTFPKNSTLTFPKKSTLTFPVNSTLSFQSEQKCKDFLIQKHLDQNKLKFDTYFYWCPRTGVRNFTLTFLRNSIFTFYKAYSCYSHIFRPHCPTLKPFILRGSRRGLGEVLGVIFFFPVILARFWQAFGRGFWAGS